MEFSKLPAGAAADKLVCSDPTIPHDDRNLVIKVSWPCGKSRQCNMRILWQHATCGYSDRVCHAAESTDGRGGDLPKYTFFAHSTHPFLHLPGTPTCSCPLPHPWHTNCTCCGAFVPLFFFSAKLSCPGVCWLDCTCTIAQHSTCCPPMHTCHAWPAQSQLYEQAASNSHTHPDLGHIAGPLKHTAAALAMA